MRLVSYDHDISDASLNETLQHVYDEQRLASTPRSVNKSVAAPGIPIVHGAHSWGQVSQSTKRMMNAVGAVHQMKKEVTSHNKRRLIFQATLVVVAGCASVIPSELILKSDKGGMAVITVANYIFAIMSSVAAGGISVVSNHKIPMKSHALIIMGNYGYSALQNYAFAFGLPMPLALVVKNGGICAQMLVGKIVMKERYATFQVLASLLITAGIIVTVLSNTKPAVPKEDDSSIEMSVGVLMMTGAMFARSLGVAASQRAYSEHGKQYTEVLFFQHALGLPLLLLNAPALWAQVLAWDSLMWTYLTASMVLNYVVTMACAQVTGLGGSVFLNLVLVSQRFISIVISAMVFNAPPYPPALMWVGAVMVVGGVTWYVLTPKPTPTARKTV